MRVLDYKQKRYKGAYKQKRYNGTRIQTETGYGYQDTNRNGIRVVG